MRLPCETFVAVVSLGFNRGAKKNLTPKNTKVIYYPTHAPMTLIKKPCNP